ncbi:2-dehydro-3-deoxygalactonokinase [Dyella sp. C11]|uniref:2-dehydro-3-deoxygalactonokinase n=1 Tax=Dyella sp. C11 TaxID=2126991 RepID=UPI000D652255|nr:2-dehydro-3-deoxygalactonokinase [Dyella sp. C11]
MSKDFIAINWGSSNFRAYLMDDNSNVIDAWSEAAGIASLDRAGMTTQIERVTERWPGAKILYACGMIGSNIGWADAGYAECPIGLDGLSSRMRVTTIADRTMHIVPGLACHRASDGAPDIMRGEETELFGLLGSGRLPNNGLVALPGTHGKWVRVVDGSVQEFMTAMSGEIFDRLTAQGLLASIVSAPASIGSAFADGVRSGASKRLGLGTQLFGARARVIRDELARDDAASYLRGLLIGAEIADARSAYSASFGDPVTLVGSTPVCAMYAEALSLLGTNARTIDAADATVLGFAALHASIGAKA